MPDSFVEHKSDVIRFAYMSDVPDSENRDTFSVITSWDGQGLYMHQNCRDVGSGSSPRQSKSRSLYWRKADLRHQLICASLPTDLKLTMSSNQLPQ